MLDLDGTLVHTAPEIAAAANLMLVDLHLPQQTSAQIESYIGEGAVMLIKRCLMGYTTIEPEAALFEQAQTLFFAHYANIVTESKPFDGVIDGLQGLLNKGYRLACVTNKPAAFTLPLLKKADLADFFEMVVSGDTLPKKKPDPIQLLHICAKLGVDVTNALLVGDSITDITAAKAAGCYIVTVPYGYNQGNTIDENLVDATIDDLTQLTGLLH
jgi:phosphoglycolate phosphatase